MASSENLFKLRKDTRIDNYLKDFEDDRLKTIPEKIKKERQSLPIFAKRTDILETIRNNQVTMVKGETGCGKTTQVSQYILEDCIQNCNGSMTNILVTQPRRISAVSVANRVAEERGEKMDQQSDSQVIRVVEKNISTLTT